MNEVQWIGGGSVTKEQIDFFLGPAAHDMIEAELCQPKHEVSQDIPTVPTSEDRANRIYSQIKEEDGEPEVVPSSYNPSSVVEVVLDEIVDTVVSQESNHDTSDQIDHTTAKYQEEKILVPVPRFTVVSKSLHFTLGWSEDDVDRLTSPFNKKRLMSREDHADLCGSIGGIHEYLQKTIKSDNIEKYASGLEKLLNSGHITNDQAKAYKKQYNIGLNEDEAKAKVWYELKYPTFIKRNRPGESKRSRRARAEKKKAREEARQREEERREQARLATASMKKSSPSSSSPSNCYRLGKRNKKFVVIDSPVKSSTPRTHNYRRKVKVAEQKVINHYKNKASQGVGRESSLSEPTNPNTRRSLKFKRRLYRKMYQNKKAVHPAPMVKYKEPYREEIRFNEDDADWDVLNEFVAIAKREAVEIELMATKKREDEKETPSDTDQYDPVKEALDFLAVNGIAVGTSVGHVEQIGSQRYTKRPVHPATLMKEELRFCRLRHVVAVLGASNTKSKRRIKNMIRRMLLNIKTRPRHSKLAITSYYTAKLEYILSKYMYNQSLRVQSALEEQVRSDGEKGGDDTHDTLSCTSSSSNTEDSNDSTDGIQFGPYPSPLFYNEESSTQDNTQALRDTNDTPSFMSSSSNEGCPNTASLSRVEEDSVDLNDSVELMIGGGITTTRRSKNVGKSAEEIRNEANKRRRDKRKDRSPTEAARANENDRVRMKNSRSSRSSTKEAQDREKDRARKKTPQAREMDRARKKTPQAREMDRARKKTPQAREMDRARKKTPQAREMDRARKKTPQVREMDRARKKTPHAREMDRARKNNPHTREKNRQQMERDRAQAKQRQRDKSCAFDETKVWEVPGKDYYHEDFEDKPQVAAQLWYDNNGSWKDRGMKWLIAYLHIDDMMSSGIIDSPRPVLTKLSTTAIKNHRTLIETVHSVFDEAKWAAQRKWQEDECIEDSEMAALMWLDSPDSKINAEVIKDAIHTLDLNSCTPVIDQAWADSLIGLKMKVPGHGIFILDRIDYSIKVDDRYYICKCDDDGDDKDYPMTYENLKKYVDMDQPLLSTFDLPEFPKETSTYIDWEHVHLRDLTIKSLQSEGENHDKLRGVLREYCFDRITQIQEYQRLTPEKQHELGARFLETQGRGVSWGKEKFNDKSIDAPLYTCASCGCRGYDCDGCEYQDVSLDDGLDILKMDASSYQRHIDKLELESHHPVKVPVNKDGKLEEIKTSKVYSLWPQDDKLIEDLCRECKKTEGSREYDDRLFEIEPCDGRCRFGQEGENKCTYNHPPRMKRYHLHPEFVEEYEMDNEKRGIRAKICSSCHDSIKGGKIPELSLANGVDFGDYRRIGLTPLTLRERHIISKVRHYINVVKIESNKKTGPSDMSEKKVQYNHHSALKGCGIIFDHDSPQVVSNLLTPESINGDVQLQFVCHKGEYDRMIAKLEAIKSANVYGRAHVIYQWLAVLRHINKWYEDDKELRELPYYYDFEKLIDECNCDLIQQAERIDNKDLEKEVNIATDDVAGVRAKTVSSTTRLDDDEDVDFPMRCVNFTASDKTEHSNRADHDHKFLVEAAATLKVDVKDGQAQYAHDAAKKRQTKSFRDKNPLNEFLTGDEGLVKAHVDVFMLGTAYDQEHKSPRLTPKQRQHLLMQYTTAAASSTGLIFHLFDQMQRHDTIRAVHAKTLDSRKFHDFVKEVTSDVFQGRLKKAVANPDSPDGKYVMKKLVPMLASAGRSATFGALERDRSKGEILALGRRFGCAPSFLTFAIDDVSSVSSIRLTTPSLDNTDFPSQVSGEIHEALRNGFGVEGHIPIPKTYYERYARLTKNPVGAALVYKKFVEDVLTILVGGKSQSSRRTTFATWDIDSTGITGTNIAYFGKTETTARGSLHFHVVLWGGISPDFLELTSDIPELCKRVGSILESMFSASVNKEEHVSDLAMHQVRTRCPKNPHLRTLPSRAMQISPDPSLAPEFASHVSTTICKCNGIHDHSFTCFKSTMGYSGCRLCKPSGLRKETLPVILEEDEEKEDEKYAYKVNKTVTPLHNLDGERPSSQNLFPLSSSDPRTIVWEMKRPPLEPLKPLPEAIEDKTREDILQYLYRQMLPKSVDDEEVLYNPPKDENCLFHVLLKGLKRARPDIAEEMTTKSLRAELMEYLESHEDEVVKADVDIEVDSADAITLKDLAEDQRNARDNIKHMEFDIKEYLKEMRDDTRYKCKRGGCLEYYLFAKKYEVNVAIHTEGDRETKDLIKGVHIGNHKPTIHLSLHNEHYKLLRYEWPWSQFATDTTPESCNESTCDGFEERPGMWLASQVDSYDFVQDNNNLFHNLMQGLVIVGPGKQSNPIESSQLTLRGLKRDLMKYLKDNPQEKFKPLEREETQQIATAILEGKVSHRLSIDKKQPTENQSPVDHYAQLIQDDELEGGELEMHLFAKSKNVNVVVYEQNRECFVESRVFEAHTVDSETIHLLRCSKTTKHNSNSSQDGTEDSMLSQDKVYFTLFMPKHYSIMKALMSIKDETTLRNIYKKISDTVQGRNGLVVDYNPLLTAQLGCNTNLLFLGSKEQSRGALFYIGPYINKNGVEIIDALPLLVKAYDDAKIHVSVADDSGTDKRTVQHTLTRTLNKLNAQMEVSDTQASGALFGLDARMSSEIFSYYNFNGYKNIIMDTLDQVKAQKRGKRALELCNRSNAHHITYDSSENEEENDWDEESCSDDKSDSETIESECDEEDETETGVEGVIDHADEDVQDKEEVQADLWKDWEDGVCDKFDMTHEKGAYGRTKLYHTDDDNFHAISYPELYRYRGEELKHLNRLEYCSLVKVATKSGDDTINTAKPSQGRKKSRQYQFGSGLAEKIGTKYHQILRSKQCTPKFFCKLPSPPGKKPSDASKIKRWRKRANNFAFHYLTMFRAETDLYDSSQACNYQYNWEAFLEFETSLRCSDRAIDHSRLEQMDRMIHGWKVNTARRMMLAKYRGRNRTKWSDQQKELNRAYKTKAMENHGDVLDYDHSFNPDLSTQQAEKIDQITKHKSECVSILQHCTPDSLEEQQEASINAKHSTTTLPLDEESYMYLKTAQPALNCKDKVRLSCPVPRLITRQVDKYLRKQGLSTDKDHAVKLLRDHFTAMYEGRSEDDDYDAPYLLICGGPGNGKSKLVETFDGMSKCMDVGSLVKTAFVGGAAVNINGSSLMGLFDIPVIEKGKDEETKKSRIIPWSDEKRKDFRKKYPNLDRLSCIIVDEISTVKPYHLAYLNARLMDLYPDSGGKLFGGRAVVLLGDFDQLPPVGGISLAAEVMQYEEAKFKKKISTDNEENALDAILSGQLDPKKCFDLKTAGVLLFQRVKHIKLTEQHRSKDPEHTALLQKMSSDGSLHPRHLKLYKDLSKEDMNGEFSFATMVVTGNAERHELNALQAKRWASHHKTKVVRWFRKRDANKWKGKPRDPNHEAIAMQDNCFYEMFVPGAAGYITENINTDIGLANGVEIKYHSLSFNTEDKERIFNEEFESDGSLVMTLDEPPSAINVELFADFPGDSDDKKKENRKKRKEWTHGSLVNDGRVVIQISSQWGQLIRNWDKENIEGSWQLGYKGSVLPMKDCFPIEPAFSVTIYKAQGRTIRRLIIFVSPHPIQLLRMSWEGLYVALSRVKYRDHIRLAVNRDTLEKEKKAMEYMVKLEKNKYTDSFFCGFEQSVDGRARIWKRDLAWKAAGFDKLPKKKATSKRRKKG